MPNSTRRSLLAALAGGTLTVIAGCSQGNQTAESSTGGSPTRGSPSQATDSPTTTPDRTQGTATTGDSPGTTPTGTVSPPPSTTSDVHVNDVEWPERRGDPGNSGRSRVAVPPETPPSKAWQFQPESSGDGWSRRMEYVPAVADGTVYAAGHPSTDRFAVYALDPETGERRWSAGVGPSESGTGRELLGEVGSTAVDGEAVYAGDNRGTIAVERDSGEVRWRSDALVIDPSVVDGMVYGAGSPPGDDRFGVVGLDAASGDAVSVWTVDGPPKPPALDASRAYLLESVAESGGGFHFDVVAVSLAEGTEVWRTTVNDHGGSPFPKYPIVHRRTVLASTAPLRGTESGARTVVALDAASGRERWSLEVGPDADSGVGSIVAAGENVYVVERHSDGPDAVGAYRLADGSQVWETTLRTGLGTGATVAKGTIYVPGDPTVALSLSDGSERWRTTGAGTPSIAIGAGGFYRAGPRTVTGFRS